MMATLHKHATFQYVSEINKSRSEEWMKGSLDTWDPADWVLAFIGEFGEFCNVLKKLKRLEDGVERTDRGTKEELMAKATKELGDAFIYLDLLGQRLGLDTYECIATAFNQVSEREGFKHRLI